MQPFKVLQEAIKAVPALRYALGVAGIFAVVAIVASFQLDPKVAVFGAIITLVLMVVLVIFARLTSVAAKHFIRPVLVMMWSFLVLIIAMATLLLTAVSFRKPAALAEWLFPMRTADEKPGATSETKSEISPEQLNAVQLQADAGDYTGAWRQVNEALKSAPGSEKGLRLQAEIAMGWLRNLFGHEESETVDMLSPCLYRATGSADKVFAADAFAHIGWGNYLKSRAGPDLDFEGPFKRALALDPQNPFAHAMWGYLLVWRDVGKFKEASEHFDAAVRSGRERPYVRDLQLASLGSQRMDDHVLDLIRVVNEIRKSGENLSFARRGRIAWHVYLGNRETVLENMNSAQPVLPPGEHLATIKWLNEKGREANAYGDFFTARLTELTGDRAGALALYRAMTQVENPGVAYSDLAKDIEQGIARCSR